MKWQRVVLFLAVLIIVMGGNRLLALDQPTDTAQARGASTPVPTVTANKQWKPQYKTFDGVEMALVPPGCFMMGSTDAQVQDVINQALKKGWPSADARKYFFAEKPRHKVCFTEPFWIDRTEVTQAQFQKFGGKAAKSPGIRRANRPVDRVTWFEARDFCDKRDARLPSEAEWEYAARGPDGLVFPWGNTFDQDKVIGNDKIAAIADVGSKPKGASWVGALDMSGNLIEWTNSIYKPYPYDADDGRESSSDRKSYRVRRGGAAGNFPLNLRAADRIGLTPDFIMTEWVGFRCARSS